MKLNLLIALIICLQLTVTAQVGSKSSLKEPDYPTISTSSLVINFDLENARQTIALLQKKQLTDAELQTWVELPGTKAVILKVRSSADTAIAAMKKTVAEQALAPQEKRFQFDFIYKNMDKMKTFIVQLDKGRDSIISALKNDLQQYLPAGKHASITLYGLMGSYSAGFAFTNDANAFYMGLHFYRNDITGVTVSAKHELFHTIQTMGYSYKPVMEKLTQIDSAYEAPYYLLRHLYLEGSAEYMADVKASMENSPFLKNEYEHGVVNAYRHDAVFYLLEHLLLDAYNKPAAMDFDQLYSILFDWNWNNPAYYAGREMMRALVIEHGPGYVQQSLERDALFFVKDYISLAKDKKETNLYRFSPEFEKMVNIMLSKMQ